MREDEIRKMIALLREHEDIDEIEAVRGPFGFRRWKVSRRREPGPVFAPAPSAAPRVEAPVSAQDEKLHDVTAPMVGTFYRAPNPNAEAYVQEGSKVQPGSVLCIIEAMKLMNEIECAASGSVQEILVENGSPVEFGQVLMRIRED